MKKLAVFIGTPTLLIIIAGALLYNTASGQDFLIDRLATLSMGQQAIDPEGLNVIVCGSASPLGNDPERAQACIAVVTPEHFFLFDIGDRASFRIAEGRLPTGRLTGIFLTHFHSDHIAGCALGEHEFLDSRARQRTQRLWPPRRGHSGQRI